MEKNIYNSLKLIKQNFDVYSKQLENPEVIADIKKYTKISKEIKSIKPVVDKFDEYLNIEQTLSDSKIILETEKDKDMIEFAREEITRSNATLPILEQELKILLLPKNENDSKNVILEIRGAAGGEEANLFAGSLFRMYSKYADIEGWKVEIIESSMSESGGFSLISGLIKGSNVYSKLKFETGSHRVQRIPTTETSGRVHTSTAVVTVIPEADESVEIEIKPSEIKIDTYRASGAGGQHVNTTDSAIRITHIPSGIVVTSQDGRSQHANKEQAFKVLKSKLYEKQIEEMEKKEGAVRKLAGMGFRSEKIRTYNFPQNRVTDHRINFTSNNLDRILEGEMDGIFSALISAEQAEKIKEAGQNSVSIATAQ